ncbi:HPr family phosphocarrier protein [Oceanotoga sp. DSM 15011]|jgi:phosphotransferase system HPr (HPr) family protein|uniref:Catabolite repression HPr-like protein/phosphocarrier protein n=1 Tax=Oceanotoga teriensis TaxID=515440 RepID=A0AA45HJA0_9BACT|nr:MULTISPECIES: HPr family phosphocarrier protein [Oceanotoga]MDN5342503.1 phosphocarrier protein HPr [Oceanotoga sp.]MDO7977497.1 HPr family phosphocarrier protein [Oceanotoga teriensis]PWJ95635.1 catabolite repression HPr-like protein/phosphocarrier protein [Oceanotoga teriensis]UYO99469.1 HPr family phosphocarrier protein [Oceanotoga sp. DSM 15011]
MEKTLKIKNKTGLHARPAALFSQKAASFNCDIKLEANGKSINAKSILSVLSLGVTQGTEIKLIANGADENEAISALTDLINSFED